MLLVAEETPAFSAVELATVGCPAMVVISCEAILLCLSISSCFIDIAPADFNFLDGCAVCNFLDGCTDENSSVCLLSDDGLRGNAPNLLTSIGVAQDLREEPDACQGINTSKYVMQHIGRKQNRSELHHLIGRSNSGVVYHHMVMLNLRFHGKPRRPDR